jgi:hypothetical protein
MRSDQRDRGLLLMFNLGLKKLVLLAAFLGDTVVFGSQGLKHFLSVFG